MSVVGSYMNDFLLVFFRILQKMKENAYFSLVREAN